MHKNLWASNHWILMWFWKAVGRSLGLQHVWSVEYDVRSTGQLSELWASNSDTDYISSTPIVRAANDAYWSSSVPWASNKFIAQKQIFRVSARFLEYLNDAFLKCQNGQDEITLATHARRGLMNCSDLSAKLHSTWTPSRQTLKMTDIFLSAPKKNCVLYHPIK
jgi:hypothetical protein